MAVSPGACAAGACCAGGTEASFSFRLIVLFTSFKDLNRSIRMASFDQRRVNVNLTTQSKNNVAFSNLSIEPSKTGAVLSMLGSGIQNNIDRKVGTLGSSKKATQTSTTGV